MDAEAPQDVFPLASEEEAAHLRGCDAKTVMRHPLYPKLLSAQIECKKASSSDLTEQRRLDKQLQQSLAEIECMVDATGKSLEGPMPEDEALSEYLTACIAAATDYANDLKRLFAKASKHAGSLSKELDDMQRNGASYWGAVPRSALDKEGEHTEVLALKRKYTEQIKQLGDELSNKKQKVPLPKHAQSALRAWFEERYVWPYPSEKEKLQLCSITGLQKKQINDWFVNTRKREWSKHFDKPPRSVAESHQVLASKGLTAD
mmetsp:Transcript_14192/g.38482  ORF Transcript_14192/g.38482 Transcript_14192/m.38482 type:complete len:261 (-) Transcript_14192:391-1173(-)|eukprot:CAMPEP_0202357392 /NCGR_PEP_ID=MMETSP1126-20121109/11433_1 /ASSEMBLY_ACC=CAM_ASM_000457 /TAXON_ID=3047 /ORGANISM="Dunaliella tertiolecta, Strain CCMP1320" /LENGTH=260 /DNA_ID=CAMNT_0048950255 /DNA_START=118 /DNA_END=900 /DNA_ORIENTATION=-